MTKFKSGESGNPNGRPKGAINKRSHLAKLLEPHADKLIEKMIELALSGDVMALRLCIERLIPKIQREPTGIDLPDELNTENIKKLENDVLRAALDGRISLEDAERLKNLIHNQSKNEPLDKIDLSKLDAVEAAKVYQKIIRGD